MWESQHTPFMPKTRHLECDMSSAIVGGPTDLE